MCRADHQLPRGSHPLSSNISFDLTAHCRASQTKHSLQPANQRADHVKMGTKRGESDN